MTDTNIKAGPYSIGSDQWPGLSRLIEEAGEVLQVAGKIIGGGGAGVHYDGTDLAVALCDEVADLQAAIAYFKAHSVAYAQRRTELNRRTEAKFVQYQRWHHEAVTSHD